MSGKDNFEKTMKDILNEGDSPAPGKTSDDKGVATSSFSSFNRPRPAPAPAPAPTAKEEDTKADDEKTEAAKPADEQPARPAPAAAPAPAPAARPARTTTDTAKKPVDYSDNVTVIAEGTTLVGSLTTAGGLRVDGNIKGDVNAASDAEINGKVIGDVEANSATIKDSDIKGNLKLKEALNVDRNSTIIGDINANTVQINGQVKGNLSVTERAHFEANAVLVGDLISSTVIIDEGAMLRGDISITSAQHDTVDVDDPVFDFDIDEDA